MIKVLTNLRRQSWFVCFMVFAMGWSSLVYALAMPMHAQMLQQQLQQQSMVNAELLHSQHQTVQKKQSDCHSADSVKLHQQHALHSDIQKNSDCESHLSSTIQVKQCADCAQLHCQTLSVWLDTAVTDPLQYFHAETLTNLHSRYTAQHLIGYWQEILRPPKT